MTTPKRKRGRPRLNPERPMTPNERKQRQRQKEEKKRAKPKRPRGRPRNPDAIRANEAKRHDYKMEWQTAKRSKCPVKIAVLDFETNPFEDQSEIYPFVGELYDGSKSKVIWDENFDDFSAAIVRALSELSPEFRWIVYAHNGGKFDFMFLVRLLRGKVSFKGRAIMEARIAPHVVIRDSMHILPTALKVYQKDEFDYNKLKKAVREKHKPEILAYLHSDCVYLYDLVDHFVERHGPKLSIGQAAYAILTQHYEIENLSEKSDAYLRQWFYGGRVECLQGPITDDSDYTLEDVNSMYPDVMATHEHPVSADYSVRGYNGLSVRPNSRTVFLEVECDNFGALVGRDENGSLTPNIKRGRFFTTIWEFETAAELGLIRDVRIHTCIDFFRRTNFAEFSIPLYNERFEMKEKLSEIEAKGGASNLIDELKRDILVHKFLLNNGFGKTAQNCRKFKEWLYTDYNMPPPGVYSGGLTYTDDDGGIWELDSEISDQVMIWKKPLPEKFWRFNNVAVGASITGAARAKLLRKIYSSNSPIYCDTDCVISKNRDYTESNKLGDWKAEKHIDKITIAGKKLYAYRDISGKETVRSKGAKNLTYNDLVAISCGQTITKTNDVPTIRKNGEQIFMERDISLTCPREYRSRIFDA